MAVLGALLRAVSLRVHSAALSIRLGQVLFGIHSLSALTKVFASSMSFRIMAVRVPLLGFCGRVVAMLIMGRT